MWVSACLSTVLLCLPHLSIGVTTFFRKSIPTSVCVIQIHCLGCTRLLVFRGRILMPQNSSQCHHHRSSIEPIHLYRLRCQWGSQSNGLHHFNRHRWRAGQHPLFCLNINRYVSLLCCSKCFNGECVTWSCLFDDCKHNDNNRPAFLSCLYTSIGKPGSRELWYLGSSVSNGLHYCRSQLNEHHDTNSSSMFRLSYSAILFCFPISARPGSCLWSQPGLPFKLWEKSRMYIICQSYRRNIPVYYYGYILYLARSIR